MGVVNTINFYEAMEKINRTNSYLLLGNGFSCAFDSCFKYKPLRNEADFKEKSHLEGIFEGLNTNDFEYVIRSLKMSIDILNNYENCEFIRKKLDDDAHSVSEILVETLSAKHPASADVISDNQYKKCLEFLSKFEIIYTLNYDLLLYWVLVHGLKHGLINVKDGFSEPSCDNCYRSFNTDISPDFFFLHGGLHLFVSGQDTYKLTYVSTGRAIIEQVNKEIRNGQYPLFVAE